MDASAACLPALHPLFFLNRPSFHLSFTCVPSLPYHLRTMHAPSLAPRPSLHPACE